MKKLAKKNGYTYPKLVRYIYSNAMQLAEEIDHSGTLPYKVVEVVSFVSDILENVVSGLFNSIHTPLRLCTTILLGLLASLRQYELYHECISSAFPC